MSEAHVSISSIFDTRGFLRGPVNGISRLVAESEAFQDRTGKFTVPSALSKVHRWSYLDNARIIQAERPFAVVFPADDLTLSRYATGVGGFTQRGAVLLVLTDGDRYPDKGREASGDDFVGWIDQVLLDIRNRAGVDGRLELNEPTLLRAPRHSQDVDDTAEAYWDVIFLMRWGP